MMSRALVVACLRAIVGAGQPRCPRNSVNSTTCIGRPLVVSQSLLYVSNRPMYVSNRPPYVYSRPMYVDNGPMFVHWSPLHAHKRPM